MVDCCTLHNITYTSISNISVFNSKYGIGFGFPTPASRVPNDRSRPCSCKDLSKEKQKGILHDLCEVLRLTDWDVIFYWSRDIRPTAGPIS